MHLKIGDDLNTAHNDQLVYSNCQDITLTLFTEFKIWLVNNCQKEEAHLNNKIDTCTLLNILEICVMNNKKLNIHLRVIAIFKKSDMLVEYSTMVAEMLLLFPNFRGQIQARTNTFSNSNQINRL